VAWVSEQTIPTERQPPVGEVNANFSGQSVPRGQRDGSLWPVNVSADPKYQTPLSPHYTITWRIWWKERRAVPSQNILFARWLAHLKMGFMFERNAPLLFLADAKLKLYISYQADMGLITLEYPAFIASTCSDTGLTFKRQSKTTAHLKRQRPHWVFGQLPFCHPC
jgi:hypothetical protein